MQLKPRIIRSSAVCHYVGLSRSSIYRLISLGKFPAPLKLGVQAVGWEQSALDKWVDNLSSN
jgi:prophage regulatory protein